jgi:hypothetical protein
MYFAPLKAPIKAELFQFRSQLPREKKLQLYATLRVYKFSSPKKKETSPNGKWQVSSQKASYRTEPF